jgi:2-oxoglutarate ferredoxin oxidoreductase subunit beta
MSEVALKAKDYKSEVKPVWCAGCGDYGELSAFTKALSDLHIDPAKIAITSGIGCSGRFSHFVKCYAFHTAHGRSLPVAIGVKAANPDLTVFCVGGDGDGLGIGGGHIPHAARKNPDLTYIIADNGIYGLTKGQTSPTTPVNRITTTAPFGAVEMPIDPVRLFLAYGITFVARCFTSDVKGLTEVLTKAVKHKGFSIIHLLSPCVNYKVMTVESLREHIAPIPEDHDTGDIKKAFQLALEEDKLYTGIFYQKQALTMLDEVHELTRRSRDKKPKNIQEIFDLFT